MAAYATIIERIRVPSQACDKATSGKGPVKRRIAEDLQGVSEPSGWVSQNLATHVIILSGLCPAKNSSRHLRHHVKRCRLRRVTVTRTDLASMAILSFSV